MRNIINVFLRSFYALLWIMNKKTGVLMLFVVILVSILSLTSLAISDPCQYVGVLTTGKFAGAELVYSSTYLPFDGHNVTIVRAFYPDATTYDQNVTHTPPLNAGFSFSLSGITIEPDTSYLYLNFTNINNTVTAETSYECLYYKVVAESAAAGSFLKGVVFLTLCIGVLIIFLWTFVIAMQQYKTGKDASRYLIISVLTGTILVAFIVTLIISLFT